MQTIGDPSSAGWNVNREDLCRNVVPLIRGSFLGKPDVSRVEAGGQVLMVKDVKGKPALFRWTIGLWLIDKEWKIYSRLAGIRGIPKPVQRLDRFAFATEFVSGRPVPRGESLPASFYDRLGKILREIHSRGVVHLDLRHKGNILLSETQEPILIDFNSSFAFGEKGLLRRVLFPVLQWIDTGGFLKLKERASPELMTPEERSFLTRFNRIRKWWIFN